MTNICYHNRQPQPTLTLELEHIWNVAADAHYDVPRPLIWKSQNLILIRSHGGGGEISNRRGQQWQLRAGTLFGIEDSKIERYRAAASHWQFHWFKIKVINGVLPLPLQQVLPIAAIDAELQRLERISEAIGNVAHIERAWGTAEFITLLYAWLASWEGARQQHLHAHQQIVEELIQQLHNNPGAAWTVEQMAEFCELGPRRFRDVFRQISGGITPKQFLDRRRVELGRDLLQMGLANVSSAATRLGFSSAFHFSQAYNRILGHRPSADLLNAETHRADEKRVCV